MIKQFFRLLGAIFVGLIISVWIIQNNTNVELTIAKKIISELERAWNVKIDTKSCRVNFFTFSLYLNNGRVTDLQKENCSWMFDQCKIHLQPLDFLRKKRINLQLTFDNVSVTSRLTGNMPDIVEHVKHMFSGGSSGMPATVKKVCINNLDLNILGASHSLNALIKGSFSIQKIRHARRDNLPNSWGGELSIKDAQLKIDDKIFVQQISTSGNFYKNIKTSSWMIQVSNFIKSLIPTPGQTYTINGVWSNDKKNVVIKNSDSALSLEMKYLGDKFNISGSFPADQVLKLASFFWLVDEYLISKLNGDCQLDLTWLINDSRLDSCSSLTVNNLSIREFGFEKLVLTLKESTDKKLTAIVDILYRQDLQATGMLKWNWVSSQGKMKLMNKLPISFLKDSSKPLGVGGYEIAAKDFFINIDFDKALNLKGDYKIQVSNSLFDGKSLKYNGSFNVESDVLKVSGKTRKGQYLIDAKICPSPCILRWIYRVGEQKLINLRCEKIKSKLLQGEIDFLVIKSFLAQSTRHMILGRNCILNLRLDQGDFFNLHGTLKLAGGSFYVPESRNIIKKMQTDFQINLPNKISLSNVNIGFFKGEIFSPKIIVQFDDQYKLINLHIPLQIRDLLINWKKDLLAIIYGNALIKITPQGNCKATANIVAKKSLLKENILSLPENSSYSSPAGLSFLQNNDFEFDVRLTSEQPIKAKTPSLETNASINLRILYQKNKNIMHTPRLTGTIRLDSGHIKFLQTKLFFEYGKVQFISNQMNDPVIDLIARNRINKYQITLQATGSLQKPIILLESNPELTEEQILGLLLAGSEDAKLQADLFAILEQNLQDIILGSKAISPGATGFFQKLAKPFKYIHITPDFTNQAARGGIKGTVSVNISDQVKAQIQKNFNMQDDFNAQVEYQLSDDVNVKGILDQRGELGAEVELRLKL